MISASLVYGMNLFIVNLIITYMWSHVAKGIFFLLLKGGTGQPQNLGGNFSMWMLLERVRFTLDGLECNKIGLSYEAFNGQPDFCFSPFWSCLHNQLWNFWEVSNLKWN